MNLQPQRHAEQTEVSGETYVSEDTQALQEARGDIARSLAAPASLTSLPVVEALHSDQTAERVEAMQAALGMLSSLDKIAEQKRSETMAKHRVEEMMALLIKETRRARRRNLLRRLKIMAFIVFVVWVLWLSQFRVAGNWWVVYWIGSGLWAADKTWGRRHEAVSALEKAGDPRAVGVLAIAARDGERAIKLTARQALLQLLPQVRADHATAIVPDQMNALLELAFQSEPDMQVAVLKALEQIGDRRALPVVQNLSLSPHPGVREQARQCLPFLTERARRAEESAMLLRGSGSPALTAAPRELLRPVAQSSTITPADELLRPMEQAE